MTESFVTKPGVFAARYSTIVAPAGASDRHFGGFAVTPTRQS
jgi:hypothetical protein